MDSLVFILTYVILLTNMLSPRKSFHPWQQEFWKVLLSWHYLPLNSGFQLRNKKKHVLCFCQVIETLVEVWENKICCGNTSWHCGNTRQQVNQLKIDNSKPPTGTSPSEEKPAAKGQEDDDGLYDPSLFHYQFWVESHLQISLWKSCLNLIYSLLLCLLKSPFHLRISSHLFQGWNKGTHKVSYLTWKVNKTSGPGCSKAC